MMPNDKAIDPAIYHNTVKKLEAVSQDLQFSQECIEQLKEDKESLQQIIKDKDLEIMALKAKIYDITNRGW